MPSQRHTASPGEAARAGAADQAGPREIPDAVVAATKAAVLAVGVRRTTLTDVARRAGVSRMTLYRLVPDVDTLVLEVLTREMAELVASAEIAHARRRTARARLVGSVGWIVRELPEQPLFRRVMDVDPELLLPYVTDRLGSTQRIALGHLRRLVAEGHADGSIRRGDPDVQAMALLMTASSFILSARPIDAAVGREAVLRELSAALDRAMRP